MALIAFLLRASRGVIVLSVVAGLTAGATGVGLIALIQHELAGESPRPAAMAWAFAGLCVAAAGARAAAQMAMIRLGQGAVAELSVYLVRRALMLPLRAFEVTNTSALLAALTEDIAILSNALVAVPHLCINIPIVLACLAYAGWMSPPILTFGVVFAMGAIAAYVALMANGMHGLTRARALQDVVVGHFRTAIGGFRELKLHRGRRMAFLEEALESDVAEARAEMVRGMTQFAAADGWGQLAFFVFIGFLLYGVTQFSPIARSTLVSTVLIVLYLMKPLDMILTFLPIIGQARASLLKIQSLLPELERQAEADTARPAQTWPPDSVESVALEGVTFTYRDAHDDVGFTLGPLDLTLRRGEIVVLAGGNGSGKTTLVKLLSGLYRPESGIARVDGRAVSEADAESHRQLFSVVFADGHLFPDLRGIATDPIDDRAREGLERLNLSRVVSVDDGVFSTLDLSQGQRRRLALLAAWLEDRPFYILDEWAANQDPSFKQMFYANLLPELRAAGKGLLVISHDEEYFEVADRVIRLREGHVLDESPLGVGDMWT
jgi:putative ATP-binding cassette transporter